MVQEAFAQLHRRWGSLRDPELALFYLRAAVANGSRNHLRSRRSRVPRPPDRGHVMTTPMVVDMLDLETRT